MTVECATPEQMRERIQNQSPINFPYWAGRFSAHLETLLRGSESKESRAVIESDLRAFISEIRRKELR